MTEFHSLHGQCPPIPDNLTCPQFTLDVHHPNRTLRVGNIPWLIEDATGRTIGYEEVMRYFSNYSTSLINTYYYSFECGRMAWLMHYIHAMEWVCHCFQLISRNTDAVLV